MTALFRTLVSMSLTGAALALCVLLLRPLLAGRARPGAVLVLWLVVVLRLILPLSIPLPLGLWNAAPQAVRAVAQVPSLYAQTETEAPSAAVDVSDPVTPPQQANTQPSQALFKPKPVLDPWTVAAYIWIAGCAAALAALLARNLLFLARLRRNRRLTAPDFAAFLRLAAARVGLKRCPQVYLIDKGRSPAVFGLVRPVLLMPQGLFETLDDEARLCVLTHELCHLRYGDTFLRALLLLTCCVHWFNPLVWLLPALVGRDMEALCDARALRALGGARARYAESLLRVAGLLADEGRQSLLLAAIDHKRHLKERIKGIMRQKKRGFSLAAALLTLTLAVAGCGTTLPASPSLTPSSTPQVTASPAQTGEAEASLEALPLREGVEALTVPATASLYTQLSPDPAKNVWAYTLSGELAEVPDLAQMALIRWHDMEYQKISDTRYECPLGQSDGYDRIAVLEGYDTITYTEILRDKDGQTVERVAEGEPAPALDEAAAQALQESLTIDAKAMFDAANPVFTTEPTLTLDGGVLTLFWTARDEVEGGFVTYTLMIRGDEAEGTTAFTYSQLGMKTLDERPTTPALTLDQALYSLNYAKALYTTDTLTEGPRHADLVAATAIQDVRLDYTSVFRDGQVYTPAYRFTLDCLYPGGNPYAYDVWVDMVTGNVYDPYEAEESDGAGNRWQLILSPYGALSGRTENAPLYTAPEAPVFLLGSGETFPIANAEKWVGDFFVTMRQYLYTMEEPRLPSNCAEEDPKLLLYQGLIEFRQAMIELSPKLRPDGENRCERLTLSNFSETAEGLVTADFFAELVQPIEAAGILGVNYQGQVAFAPEGGEWRIASLLITSGAPQEYLDMVEALGDGDTAKARAIVKAEIDYYKAQNN